MYIYKHSYMYMICEQSLFCLISPFLLHSLPAFQPQQVCAHQVHLRPTELAGREASDNADRPGQELSWHSKTNSPYGFSETLGISKTQRIKRHIFCLCLLALVFLQHCRHLSASAQNALFCWDFCIAEDFKAFA